MEIKFRSHATGLFAFAIDIKVKQGSVCGLRQNGNKRHGKFLAFRL